MQILAYPHKKFLSNANLQIAKGNNIYIYLSGTWNANLISPKIIHLLNNTDSSETSWKFIFCFFLNPNFFCAFFYATSEKYTINYINANKKIIKFQKSRKNKIK